MRSWIARCCLLVSCTLLAFVAAATGPTMFSAADVFQLQWADQPQISPDGKQVVYQRDWFDIMKDRKRSNLWIVESDASDNRPLTSGSSNDAGTEVGS